MNTIKIRDYSVEFESTVIALTSLLKSMIPFEFMRIRV